jgi:hypothetical protein
LNYQLKENHMPTIEQSELAVIAQNNNLDESRVQSLLKDFSDPFTEAQTLLKQASAITVTDEHQTDNMKAAKAARLALKKVRTNTENIRKTAKEAALREGKAIDGMANIIKAMIVPAEQHLEQLENYAINIVAERRATRIAERTLALQPYTSNVDMYNFADLSEEDFAELLASVKGAYEKKIADEKAEQERVAAEQAQAELDRVEREKEERRRRLAAEKKAKAERKLREEAEAKAAAERAEAARVAAEKQKEADEQLAKERAERAKIEAEQKRLADEKAAKEEAERKAAAEKAAAEKAAAAAPDKEKLHSYITELSTVVCPDLSTPEARELQAKIENGLAQLVNHSVTLIDRL